MYKREKQLLIRFALVIAMTVFMVLAVIVMKDRIGRSESVVAMNDLARKIWDYRNQSNSLPDDSYIADLQGKLLGSARTGDIYYRKKWISYASGPETILAYTKKQPSGFWSEGYVVLRLNGKVQWLTLQEFDEEMALQWGKNEPRH